VLLDDHALVQVISRQQPEWVAVFTGLTVRQFDKLVGVVASRGGEQTGTGRRWGLSLADRVLLVAVYYRTNLTYRQVALLFGISKSAAGRVVEHLAPLLALAPVARAHGPNTVLIVDGTLVPTHDRRLSASSKNYRYSVNMQIAIDANTRLTVAVGRPTPGNRHDCRAYRESGVNRQCHGATVMADGGYQGNPEVIMPYRLPTNGSPLPGWKHDLEHHPQADSSPRRARTSAYESVEHPAQLPPQTRRRVVRHLRCRSDAQPRHDPLTIRTSPQQPRSPIRPPNAIDHYGTAFSRWLGGGSR
jgi:hypothetical protein